MKRIAALDMDDMEILLKNIEDFFDVIKENAELKQKNQELKKRVSELESAGKVTSEKRIRYHFTCEHKRNEYGETSCTFYDHGVRIPFKDTLDYLTALMLVELVIAEPTKEKGDELGNFLTSIVKGEK